MPSWKAILTTAVIAIVAVYVFDNYVRPRLMAS